MENTALNGTTATKDQEDWKKKKGSGRIVAASLALLLGLSFYAGRQVGGANLREMGMTNAAAPSSSMSLVGSGTAASDLKTLTLVVDDDEVIDGLLPEWWWLGETGTSDSGLGPCTTTADCTVPASLGPTYSGVCVDGYCQFTYNPDWTFPVGGYCGYTLVNRCAIPTGLTHGVCREGYCQTGTSGSSCGQTSDCVPIAGLYQPHGVCREGKCQRGVKGDFCGQDKDCLSGFCRPIGKCGGSS